MGDWDLQPGSGVCFEWGPTCARRRTREAACLFIVDVLSFSTSVSVAVEKGIRVLPFWWPDGSAAGTEKAAAV
ncbi:hypothetical protein [Streptomyces sp. NPDC047061]|uniref:hypothetical protein n=1 Tax=Streptomyces sp. NPDC047061 TaxID=3154605 RepID=UPI0033E8FF24